MPTLSFGRTGSISVWLWYSSLRRCSVSAFTCNQNLIFLPKSSTLLPSPRRQGTYPGARCRRSAGSVGPACSPCSTSPSPPWRRGGIEIVGLPVAESGKHVLEMPAGRKGILYCIFNGTGLNGNTLHDIGLTTRINL